MTIEEVLKRAKKDTIAFIEYQFSDFLGQVKSLTQPVEQLSDALTHGVWFDGSSIEGFARIHESDMILRPDPATYALLPWWSENGKGGVARFMCDIALPNGDPFPGDPRTTLKRALAKAKKLGYEYNVGPELEFFLFKKDENGEIVRYSRGNGDYFVLSMDETYEIKREIIRSLKTIGITVEMSHYEVAHNQHEIDFRYADALSTADAAMTLKYTVKYIAARHGYHATFMPKPIYGVNGSGMHVHQSLFKQGKNAFFKRSDPYGLSEIAYKFVGGQLRYVRDIAAIVAPTVNSYKRLTPGFEAPVYICWARKNRSALIRVPEITKGRDSATRVELRCPDGSSNPYLTFAAMLSAGLKGIEEKISPPKPVEEDVYEFSDEQMKQYYIDKLPSTLAESLDLFENGVIGKEVFDTATFSRYLAAKRAEWDVFRTHVTAWEVDRYIEIY
ncbi:type I glutamate--ammonia ligase [Candidatus Roizmanbacteria bacterium]|nr:type I glutamate--ammonia ligase [Candidatus Roizmanbacteria bacterium]